MGLNKDIVALGELLIDFSEVGYGNNNMKIFEQNPGGAPANLLTAASHMGCKCAFIGKVGNDMHGKFLRDILIKEEIDVSNLILDDDFFTTLAFVEIANDGERNFSFARKPGADTQLNKDELNNDLISNCKIFHFGSLSLTNNPSKEATLEAIKIAKESNVLISYDPNYRASLWNNQIQAIEEMKSVIKDVDIMKVSDEESLLLTNSKTYEEAADKLLAQGIKLLAITLGSDGVMIARKDKKEIIKGFKIKTVDTTGAGDSFWGGFLSSYLSYQQDINEISWDNLKKCARIGNALAALCVSKRGGIPAIPSKEDVFSFITMI